MHACVHVCLHIALEASVHSCELGKHQASSHSPTAGSHKGGKRLGIGELGISHQDIGLAELYLGILPLLFIFLNCTIFAYILFLRNSNPRFKPETFFDNYHQIFQMMFFLFIFYLYIIYCIHTHMCV
jgi:hypothetical protein